MIQIYILACGLLPVQYIPTIVNGAPANISEFPWHATLYRAENSFAPKRFICGATIIHERLLITAAHCVYDEVAQKLDDASKFYIVTGNIFQDYDSPLHNNITVKKAKVSIFIIFSVSNFYNYYNNHVLYIYFR